MNKAIDKVLLAANRVCRFKLHFYRVQWKNWSQIRSTDTILVLKLVKLCEKKKRGRHLLQSQKGFSLSVADVNSLIPK